MNRPLELMPKNNLMAKYAQYHFINDMDKDMIPDNKAPLRSALRLPYLSEMIPKTKLPISKPNM